MFFRMMLTCCLALGSGSAAYAGEVVTFADVQAKKVKGKVDAYQAKNGWILRVGEVVTLGPTVETWLADGGYFLIPAETAFAAGQDVTVKKIVVKCANRSCAVVVNTTAPPRTALALKSVNIEATISKGELITAGAVSKQDRDAAIEDLKRAKEMLELDVISQEEYEATKERLTPIIRGGQ